MEQVSHISTELQIPGAGRVRLLSDAEPDSQDFRFYLEFIPQDLRLTPTKYVLNITENGRFSVAVFDPNDGQAENIEYDELGRS